ncbi:2OG-Fe dioxygenase family protein [Candidatus Paracaedibacter symbiosus]|uniref:2OG-Fe dioxygenase family protein n=1 Tax=Candidatus Paracaedibacter symbiosus TaxID=244582 RepID=UPI000509D209|nr:2OG-Fe dioxygenase family protein [Candidatus Paracaedibacter symbiosus]
MNTIKLISLPCFSEKLIKSFNAIPDDQYLKTEFPFRKRSYNAGKIISNIFHWEESNTLFLQTKDLNQYVGGISRHFVPVPASIREDICQKIIMNAYAQLPASDYKVGVHQIRIFSDTLNQGIPTPEGIHQDGFDFVAVACINTRNVSGGVSVLFDAKDHARIVFEGILTPGTQIVFSDKDFAHYTSNVTPKIPGVAFRDVIVTTFLAI